MQNNKNLLNILNNITETPHEGEKNKERILIIDSLNLFFRNFAMLNMINSDGFHIGGMGGFLRSLGSIIKQIQPTSVYVVFDGIGSSNNRKNILPEYKSGRNEHRITNWEVFNNIDEEHDAKINQIVRLIQYLKLIPVKLISIDKVEADDIIAFLSKELEKKDNLISFIVSSDKDFLQLISDKTIIYSPIVREYYDKVLLKNKYNILPENFIIYKTLLGDNSDKIKGIKGLGPKGILKYFPELETSVISLEDIYEISSKKIKEHIIYARIISEFDRIKNMYKIMDLSNPMIDDKGKKEVIDLINSNELNFDSQTFVHMYRSDMLGNLIKNVDFWLQDVFGPLFHKK
jgi:DNA polymerase-1